MRNWWTPSDFAHFRASTAKLAAQYDSYKPFPDISVNGKQTLAEDTADIAGISAAYDGYRASLKGRSAPVVHGFTGDQQFFIAFGQNWRIEDAPRSTPRTGVDRFARPGRVSRRHGTQRGRVVPAFDVKPGQALYLAPQDRVKIW